MKAEDYIKIAYVKFPNNKGLCSNKISLRRSAFIKGLEYAHDYNKRLSDELSQKQNDIDELVEALRLAQYRILPVTEYLELTEKHTKK